MILCSMLFFSRVYVCWIKGDEKQASYIDMYVSQYTKKNPYGQMNNMECHNGFQDCSHVFGGWLTFSKVSHCLSAFSLAVDHSYLRPHTIGQKTFC